MRRRIEDMGEVRRRGARQEADTMEREEDEGRRGETVGTGRKRIEKEEERRGGEEE